MLACFYHCAIAVYCFMSLKYDKIFFKARDKYILSIMIVHAQGLFIKFLRKNKASVLLQLVIAMG